MESICLIKPHAMEDFGNILQEFIDNCINITNIKLVTEDKKFWSPIFGDESSKMGKNTILAIVVEGVDIFNTLETFIGNDKVILADESTLRYTYGDLYGDKFNNVMYVCKNSKEYNKLNKLLF